MTCFVICHFNRHIATHFIIRIILMPMILVHLIYI